MKIKDIVEQLLNGIKLDDILKKQSDSKKGYIVEALFKILTIDKNITSVNYKYSEIYDCQTSDILKSEPISNVKKIFDSNVSNKEGGKADFISKFDKCYTFTSSKYVDKFIPGKSDIEKLNNELYKDIGLSPKQYKLAFVCNEKSDVINHNHQHSTVKKYFDEIIENELLFDFNDIRNGCEEFYEKNKDKSYDEYCEYINTEYLGNSRESLRERLHQRMTLLKFIKNFEEGESKHLISHKTRTGKTITQLLIIKWLIDNNKKVLFMTSVPSTLDNFITDLQKYINFKNIKYNKLDKKELNELSNTCLSDCLTLCSIQFLKNDEKGKKKEFLKNQNYDAMFIDECHYGSSTTKTKDDIINIDTEDIRKSAKLSVFSSGTSQKTQKFYKIKKSCIYKWELYDESQMKLLHDCNYNNKEIIKDMGIRHGSQFKQVIGDKTLDKDYTNMPTQMLMKATIPERLKQKIDDYKLNNNKNIGFSLKSLFSLQSKMIKNKDGTYSKKYLPKFELEETTDGESILEDYLDNIISNDKNNKKSVMKRIEYVQKKHHSRKSSKEDPKLFIIYLPTHTGNSSIHLLQQAMINFMERKGLWKKYNIVKANSKENMGDYKKEYNDEIKSAMKETKKDKKLGCILLLGDKGTTGITYDDCDVSIHLDDGHNLESQIQKRARPGTPAKDKKIFINVDMNIQRTFYTLTDTIKQYQIGNKKSWTYKEILIYLYKNNIFLWDEEDFNNGEMTPKELESYFKTLSEKIVDGIDPIEIMNELCDEIDCTDNLKTYIDGNIDNTNYTYQVNSDLEGEQKDVPKDTPTRTKIDKIVKEQKGKLNKGDEDGEKEIEKNVENTINKTAELVKSKRGLPFLSLILRVKNYKDMKDILENEDELIKEVLESKISDIKKTYVYDIYKILMNNIINEHQEIVNQIIEIYNNTEPKKLRTIIANHFISSREEELENAEIPTPPTLCDEMLIPIPEDFWKSIHRVGELCCGKGNFVLAIFDKFYEGLKEEYPDNYKRCKIIATRCLYFTDINPLDIFITSSILKCHIKSKCGDCELDYEFNSYVCDTLKTDIKNYFGIKGFHAIIGNPPYNSPGKTATGNTIWQLFTHKAIDEWLVKDGYLAYVHPPGWRKPNTSRGKFNGMYKKMAIDNQMIYLEMHNTKDGKKVFKKGTRYDFYLLQKKERTVNTQIKDVKYVKSEIDLSLFEWLPNSNINDIMKILSKDKSDICELIYSPSSYEHRKKWMSHVKNTEFKYPCIHSTPQKGIRYMYSNTNQNGHFGVSKIIFGETGIYNAIIDLKGKYGLTNGCIGIKINKQNAEQYKRFLESNKMHNIISSCSYSSFRVDWNIFRYFKKDFWKEFLNDEDNDSEIVKTNSKKKTVKDSNKEKKESDKHSNKGFSIGDVVKWKDSKGNQEGTITKINPNTINITSIKGENKRVNPDKLSLK